MSKAVLYMITPMIDKSHEADGYLGAIKQIGWNTFRYHPQTKAEIRNLIINHNLCLIFAPSKYGVRQLPIETINEYGVGVVVKPLLFIKDDTDLCRLKEIENLLIRSPIDPSIVDKYLPKWCEAGLKPEHILPAIDLKSSMPESLNKTLDMAVFYSHMDKELSRWVKTIKDRAIINNCTIEIVDLTKIGLQEIVNIIGKTKIICNLYSQASRLKSPNQYDFLSILCGSSLITNSSIVSEILQDSVVFVETITQIVNHFEQAFPNYEHPTEELLRISTFIGHQHSYLNRLMQIFQHFKCQEDIGQSEQVLSRLVIQHAWAMQARLESKEEVYGQTANIS